MRGNEVYQHYRDLSIHDIWIEFFIIKKEPLLRSQGWLPATYGSNFMETKAHHYFRLVIMEIKGVHLTYGLDCIYQTNNSDIFFSF